MDTEAAHRTPPSAGPTALRGGTKLHQSPLRTQRQKRVTYTQGRGGEVGVSTKASWCPEMSGTQEAPTAHHSKGVPTALQGAPQLHQRVCPSRPRHRHARDTEFGKPGGGVWMEGSSSHANKAHEGGYSRISNVKRSHALLGARRETVLPGAAGGRCTVLCISSDPPHICSHLKINAAIETSFGVQAPYCP